MAVLGHRLWSEAFGSDPGAVGSTVRIGGRAQTVFGVLPPGYEPVLRRQGLWTLLDFPSDPVVLFDEHTYDAVCRLAQGVCLAGARAELRTLGGQLERLQRELNRDRSLIARPCERSEGSERHVAVGMALSVRRAASARRGKPLLRWERAKSGVSPAGPSASASTPSYPLGRCESARGCGSGINTLLESRSSTKPWT